MEHQRKEPIRILQCVNIMNRAGLETMLMNYYRNIDRKKIQFDFLTHRPEAGEYDEEIKKLGGRIFHAPRLYPQNYIKYFKWMHQFFLDHPEYEIVHSHIDAMSYFPLLTAKKNGIKYRIAHSHTTKLDLDFKLPIKLFAKEKIVKVANCYFACGNKAGKFLFKNEKFDVIHNAIDLNKFKYNEDLRNEYRKKLNIPLDYYVIGHVGRMCYIKNQIFLLNLLNEILKINKKVKLLLVGNGPDELKLKEKSKKLGIENNVIFLKSRSDVNNLYNVMDIFIMPSLFEGVPLVGVEAQANGLPCIFSNRISKEIILNKNSILIKTNRNIHECIEIINKNDFKRKTNTLLNLKNKGYDINDESNKLCEYYMNLLRIGGKEDEHNDFNSNL